MAWILVGVLPLRMANAFDHDGRGYFVDEFYKKERQMSSCWRPALSSRIHGGKACLL
jgi:hypothetical protein